jgi:hypothetical protein
MPRWGSAAWQGQEEQGLGADRGQLAGGARAWSGAGWSASPTTRARCSTAASVATRRREPRVASLPRRDEARVRAVCRARAGRRRPEPATRHWSGPPRVAVRRTRAAPTSGRWGSKPASAPCSARAAPPSGTTSGRSRTSAGPTSRAGSPAPICSTASGCAASAAALTPASSCAAHDPAGSDGHRGVRRAGPALELEATGGPPASAPSRPATRSTAQEAVIARLAGDGCRTRRSAAGCSSAPARSSTTMGGLRQARHQLARPAHRGSCPATSQPPGRSSPPPAGGACSARRQGMAGQSRWPLADRTLARTTPRRAAAGTALHIRSPSRIPVTALTGAPADNGGRHE